jgi:23S rRNA A2030 N6-methylase RlmJ
MDWKVMDDPANIENRNGGNGGDLVKHTVYLATLRFLLAREPWSDRLLVRECHAGRGVYQIPNGDIRSHLLRCLYTNPIGGDPVLLQKSQEQILGALGCWTSATEAVRWYAGSALINAATLADNHDNVHRLELYEWLPETRRILRSVLTAARPDAHRLWSVLPEEEQSREFDGEA